MKLIIGGAFQGKKDYVLSRFGMEAKELIDGKNCSFPEIFACRGIAHFHEYIRRMMRSEMGTENLVKEIMGQNSGIIIITNELGYGVVPMDAFERNYRETVGRICCNLASEAEEVHRVVCGIGTVIKHA